MALAKFMKDVAAANGYNIHDGDIDITFEYELREYKAEDDKFLPGTLYGFAVKLSKAEKKALFEEAKAKGAISSKLSGLDEWKPLYDGVYPLYWGTEWASGDRLYKHLTGHSGNWTLCLLERQLAHLSRKYVSYANIRLSLHTELEDYLKDEYPELLKTQKGKGPKARQEGERVDNLNAEGKTKKT